MDIGPYLIIRQLGQGGQGTVYLGQDEHGGLTAVKVMNGGIDRAFARELAAARQVDEFCTARVLRADLDHRPPYVASEYIDGPALAAVAPVRGAALTRLAIGTATKDGASGTPPYMAPEQFRGLPVGPASDVFAWGSTMVYADHDAVSSLDTRMDMTVTAEHIELTRRVILADAEYVDGKEVTDPAKERIMQEARCPRAMGAVGVIIDLARLTENVQASGRRYSGALVTTKAPESLRQQFSAMGDPERKLAETSLSWVLTLDARNRPKRFELSWHFKLDEATRLTSSFGTEYSAWREGEIREPGS